MSATLTIIGKDLRQRLREGSLPLFAVALPLGLAFLFQLLIGGADQGFTARYAVVDTDRGVAAVAFTERLDAAAAAGPIELRPADTPAEVRRLVDRGEVHAAFVIPAGFSDDIAAGRPATLDLIGDPAAAIALGLARELAEGYAVDLAGVPPAVTLATDDTLANRQLDTGTYYASGMAVFFLFFATMFSLGSLLTERSERTLARMLAAPINPGTVLVAKLASTALVGAAAMAVLVAATTLLFGASWGPPLGVAGLTAAVVLAATMLMAVVVSFTRTAEQASNWQGGIAVLMGLFGGAFFPVAQLGTLATVSYLTPHRWFLQGLADLQAGELSAVLAPAGVLLGIAAAGGAVLALRVRRVVRA